jgi:hypothetical protein
VAVVIRELTRGEGSRQVRSEVVVAIRELARE